MGSGKSKLGKKLASKLNKGFIDLDSQIEEREGLSVSEIFNQKSEEHFRKTEQEELLKLGSEKQAVISLGGGACCNDLSWAFLEQNGLVIYIKEPIEILYGRLKQNRSRRPLIASLDDESLRDFIEKKLEERLTYYKKAHFTYEQERTSLPFLVKQIEDYLR